MFSTQNLNRFHWRIFFRIVLIQAVLILILFLTAGQLIRNEVEDSLVTRTWTLDLGSFDRWFFVFLCALIFIQGAFSLFLARRLVFPIGRMLVQARKVLDTGLPLEDSTTLSGIDYSTNPDESWSDLESSIVDIRKDLETKIQSLVAEREEQAILMSAISDAILAVDLLGAPLFYNTRFALLIGNQELKNQRRLWEIFRNPEILEAYRIALKSGTSSSVPAVPFDSPTGKRFYSISVSPLRKTGAVGIFHDVTELKHAEQIRIDFVANVSHELRTPLTAIKGYTDTLIQDIKDGKEITPGFLEVISRNSDRLLNLMNDLLDLSALDSNERVHHSTINIRELTEKTIASLRSGYEKKNHEIGFEIQAEVLWADPRRVEQVLVNLLDNANKYTPSGGSIHLRWEKGVSSDGNVILLKVSDTGPGIAPEHQARLFERFYRVDKGRSRDQGGTGLGLAIVKHILQRHGGSVWVESQLGRGSTFVCSFPDCGPSKKDELSPIS